MSVNWSHRKIDPHLGKKVSEGNMATVSADATPRRFQRVFTKPTRIAVRVVHATAKVRLGKDQGEVSNTLASGSDTSAIVLTQSNTDGSAGAGTVAQPFTEWWTGELWYVSDQAAGAQVNITIIAEAPFA
jgi:hypothetical protein